MVVQVQITLSEDGAVNVKTGGPGSGNQLLVLGMLEFAKNALMQPQQEARSPRAPLLVASGPLPGR